MPARRQLTFEERGRRTAIARTIKFVIMFLALVAWAYVALTSRLFDSAMLAAGFATLVAQGALVVMITAQVVLGKTRRLLRHRRIARQRPLFQEKLAAYVAGHENSSAVERLVERCPAEVEFCILEFLPALRGGQRAKLVRLANRLGFVQRWLDEYRTGSPIVRRAAITNLALVAGGSARDELLTALADRSRSVRVEAAKALLGIGERDGAIEVFEYVEVFDFMLSETPLVRAVLSDELKVHASILANEVIPRLLEHGHHGRLREALRLLVSWRVWMSCEALESLLQRRELDLVALALGVVPFAAERDRLKGHVLLALGSDDRSVRSAAVECAGRMHMHEAGGRLSLLLSGDDPRIAHAAAQALAQLGETGRARLDAAVVEANRVAAGAALEALERWRVAHLRVAA